MEIGGMQLAKGKEVILVIPDLQIPFHHPDAFDFLDWVKRKVCPTKVVCIGDSIDSHALSSFISDPDGFSAGYEHKEAIQHLKILYSIFPRCIEVESNHNNRIYRRAFAAGIPKMFLKSFAEFMQAPKGWEFVPDVILDDITFEHGDAFSGMYAARIAALSNMRSTVIGHHHSASAIHYVANKEKLLFGMNVGCLIDVDSYAFEYGKKNRFKPTLTCGIIDRGIPQLIPMMIDSKKRWRP